MKAKHLIIAVGAVALVALGINDWINKDANALERLNDRVGLKVDCKVQKVKGQRWGVCRYKNGAPANAWLDRDGTWTAGNGNAIEAFNRLEHAEDKQNLPNVQIDYANPPRMPAGLLE